MQKLHKSLRRAFNVAIGQGKLSRNPCAFVERRPHRREERTALSGKQVPLLFKETAGHRLESMFRFGILGIMRPSEIFALAWRDVDLEAGVIDILNNLQIRPRKILPAKCDSARRIPISMLTVASLRRHLIAMAREGHQSPYVFVTPRGKALAGGPMNDELAAICTRATIPRITLYELRHTGVSIFGKSGVSAAVAADIAGHSDTQLTLNVYTHTGEAQHRAGVDQAERFVDAAQEAVNSVESGGANRKA